MSERFYTNWPLQLGPTILDGPEARHLATVCRLRPGDAVCLFNGDGHEYPARVVTVDRRQVQLEITERVTPLRELSFHLEIAAPLPRGDRAQFMLEKLTELGVTRFVPLTTARSVVHPREAKMDKLDRYVIEASKQCGRNVLMDVGPLVEWEEYCKRTQLPKQRMVAHPGGMVKLGQAAWMDAACAVGPEGGFTETEIAAAVTAGWQVIDLGPRILRVETAALVMAALATTVT